MKVTFFSNFLNHHQLPFCKEMQRLLGADFKFVATEKIPEERLKLGYKDMSEEYSFVINANNGKKEYNYALELGLNSDVVLIGSAPNIFIEERIKKNKLIFRYSERIFKEGQVQILNPRNFGSLIKNHTRYKNKEIYMLSSSAYTPIDYALAGAYINKTYKWGYFPEFKEYEIKSVVEKKKSEVVNLLWVGRFLKWKHPEAAIEVAKKLKMEKIKFKLKIVGRGELEEKLKSLVIRYDLNKEVEFLGSMEPEKVRIEMEKSNIFLLTSDYNEGWGAVLNEAMNSGCAIVASHACGATGYLLKHKENGMIYKSDKLEELYTKVKELIEDENLRLKIGIKAYDTIKEVWNYKNAANNFLKLSESLLNNEHTEFEEGPCSKAKIISQRKMYDVLTENLI